MLSDEMIINGKRAVIRSFAKINLTLDILGKRSDGYHDVEMIMQTTSLSDMLVLEKRNSGIRLSSNLRYLPNNEKNLAYKAAKCFFEHTKIRGGIDIEINKNIPVAAGLAGGSGNCAAVLCALNSLYNAELDISELCRIGATLGADVPYCICGGTQLASGIGEILTPLPKMPSVSVLLVKPPISVSTAAVYEQIDSVVPQKRPDTRAAINTLEKGDIYALSDNLCNVMESVTEKMHPVIRGIKEKMLLNGALGAVMSGSGPTVFGIFDDEKKAKLSHDSFAYQYKDVFLAKTI